MKKRGRKGRIRRRRKWQFGDVQWIRREELVKVGGRESLVRDGNCGSGRWWEELRGALCPSAVLKDTVVLLMLVTVVVVVVVVADSFFYEDCPAHGPSQ